LVRPKSERAAPWPIGQLPSVLTGVWSFMVFSNPLLWLLKGARFVQESLISNYRLAEAKLSAFLGNCHRQNRFNASF
jgi:hypothetical protein